MGAAFYPADMLQKTTGLQSAEGDFILKFATGKFIVPAESVFPWNNPVPFGGEKETIRVRSACCHCTAHALPGNMHLFMQFLATCTRFTAPEDTGKHRC
jgi:hypothetical protein